MKRIRKIPSHRKRAGTERGTAGKESHGGVHGALKRRRLTKSRNELPLPSKQSKVSKESPEAKKAKVKKTASAAAREVARRKRADESLRRRLKQAEEAIELAREEADAAKAAKADFLANISHEVRTPMTGIIGMAGLLAETELSPMQREYCEIIRRSSESLLTVINEILDFSKADAGKMELEVIDFDLRAAVEEIMALFVSPAADKEIELINFIRYDVPTALRGDPGRLRQVLSNMINNALKFTARGEVVLRVMVVDHRPTAVTLRFEVADTGIGIPKEDSDKLFNPFTQVDASATRKYGGTGIGLAICKNFVALMGGEIGVESEIGKGSTFWFTVPLMKQRAVERQPLKPRHDLAGLRALVVESNATNCDVLEHYLDALGIACECIDNGPAALELLRRAAANGASFDVVILDFKLLALDELETARRVREGATGDPPKLLLLTSVGKRGDAKLAEQAGFDAYLTKPVSFACLTECLALVMGEPRSGGVLSPLITRHMVAEMKSRNRVRVLVADDNHINQKVIARLLESMGCRADVVGSGKEALEAFILVPYDIVLMDLQMPDCDAIDACRRIQTLAKETGRRTAVIAVSADAMNGHRKTVPDLGFDGFVGKPVEAQELKTIIELKTAVDSGGTDSPEDVLNIVGALARVGGDRDLLAKIARMFLELYPRLLEESREAVSRSDCELLSRAVRTLASSAGQLGAARVRAAAKKVEELGRGGDLAGAASALGELDNEIRLVASAISDDSNPHHAWLRAEA